VPQEIFTANSSQLILSALFSVACSLRKDCNVKINQCTIMALHNFFVDYPEEEMQVFTSDRMKLAVISSVVISHSNL